MKQIGVGLLGFGTVGAGVVDGLCRNREVMSQRLGVDVVLRKIADLDTTSDRGVKVAPGMLTSDAMSVIHDPEIQIIVELIGGTTVSRTFILEALNSGKSVVTANKKLLAEYGQEIFDAAEKNRVDIYFGASVGGGIPIIRVLREGLAGNEIETIHGILNGTCNYILTRMENEGAAFDEVLKAAQDAGYAEANPSLDIDGFDTAHKAVILASLAYGFHVPLNEVRVEGIRNLEGIDVKYAKEFGYRIKLLAAIRRDGDEIEIGVHPTLVSMNHMLASVNDVFNAAMVHGDLSGDTLYYGRGAGRAPTASTVIGDIGDIARNLSTGIPRYSRAINTVNSTKFRIRNADEISSKFYVRLMVRDRAGSLGIMTNAFGKHGVSIRAATQKETDEEFPGYVPVVFLTHRATHAAITAALAEITRSDVINAEPVLLRVL
ncbi:MAG: homoserine dehydrogenase [Kiritimatiellae bacterium]|nr:homoserine dehydrogenase [Kiritimatiellia bacterium]